nr:related to MEF2-translation elongation factor, mitochondrial [Melanopsichium pennsylvanicum 4]
MGRLPSLPNARFTSTRLSSLRRASILHTTPLPRLAAPQSARTLVPPASATVRLFSSTSQCHAADTNASHPEKHPISSLRNISIIAHIDAGKTTLTERLLHLTDALGNSTSSASVPGDVDSGSTVTDFLEAERQRGITIQSAAVGPVWWPPPKSTKVSPIGITLVDTPGHIDFGIEVERALRVVDGAVVVLDGVEGVESQTENVWSQARRYDVKASILFINKLDRMGSSVAQSLRSVIRSGLHSKPLLLQLPLAVAGKDGAGISGLVDLVEMQTLTFSGKAGELIAQNPLKESHEMYQEAKQARNTLVECLASLDDQLLEELFGLPTTSGEEPHSKIPPLSLRAAIRRQTLNGTVLPVLCGSAAKNIGIQPLLDAIAAYLPSPADKPAVVGNIAVNSSPLSKNDKKKDSSTENSTGKQITIALNDKRTTALAFKVVHDKRRGPTTFVRVYSGTLNRASTLFNTTTGARERLSKVLFPFADQYTETSTLRAGQIGVILGLRDTRTGDTLVDVSSQPGSTNYLDPTEVKSLRLKRVHIPPPVFSMSLEPASKSDVDSVSEALNLLIRTDPSLRLDESGEGTTGQTVLSGMGELHLEIAKDRLSNEFGVNARMGAVRVSYKETLSEEVGVLVEQELVDRELGGKKIKVGAKVMVRALSEDEEGLGKTAEAMMFGGNVVKINFDSDSSAVTKDSAKPEDEGDIQAYLSESPRQSRGKVSSKTPASVDSRFVDSALPSGMDIVTIETQFKTATIAALSRGPLTSNPLMGLHVTICDIQLFGELSSSAAISYLLSHLVRKVLQIEAKIDPNSGMVKGPATALTSLMEPMMATRIIVPEAHLGKVINDITSEQNGIVQDVVHQTSDSPTDSLSNDGSAEQVENEVFIPHPTNAFERQSAASSTGASAKGTDGGSGKAEIHAVVPLAYLVRYSSKLRALTAGNAQFSMQLQGFAKVSVSRQYEILHELGR